MPTESEIIKHLLVKMVRLHVKKGDEDLFLYDVPAETAVSTVTKDLTEIQNARLKIGRMAAEMENLANHGIHLPPNMVGLMDDQLTELKLRDEFAATYTPSGGVEYRKDELFRRNGHAPVESMAKVLRDTLEDARNAVNKNLAKSGIPLTISLIRHEFLKLKGAFRVFLHACLMLCLIICRLVCLSVCLLVYLSIVVLQLFQFLLPPESMRHHGFLLFLSEHRLPTRSTFSFLGNLNRDFGLIITADVVF